MKNFFIILAMKILNLILKICHKNGGNFLGKIAYDWNPKIFKYFKVNCPVIAVSATNGKTMTNNCIGYTLKTAGYKVVSNIEGNNMETGILSTILKNCTLTGKIKADYLVFEVDESYIPVVFKDFRLDTLVILNFFRDQLDRNGEVESLILRINKFLKTYNGNLVLNNDDPNVSRLGQANPSNENIYYFSVDRYNFATDTIKEAGEGKFCPFCKTRLEYEYYQYSHVGKFKLAKSFDCIGRSLPVRRISSNFNKMKIFLSILFICKSSVKFKNIKSRDSFQIFIDCLLVTAKKPVFI
mgnify:CR=1 FL=1